MTMPSQFSLDRPEMEKRIREGGSVMLPDGRIVSRVEDLPNPADIAANDRVRLEAERDRLQSVVDDHQRQLRTVNDRLGALPKVAPAVAPKPHADDPGKAKSDK
jgi:hypothetical protein